MTSTTTATTTAPGQTAAKYDFSHSVGALTLRAYLQALVDAREEATPDAEASADELTNTYHYVDDGKRALVGAMLAAYVDGWERGYALGFDAGYKDGAGDGGRGFA